MTPGPLSILLYVFCSGSQWPNKVVLSEAILIRAGLLFEFLFGMSVANTHANTHKHLPHSVLTNISHKATAVRHMRLHQVNNPLYLKSALRCKQRIHEWLAFTMWFLLGFNSELLIRTDQVLVTLILFLYPHSFGTMVYNWGGDWLKMLLKFNFFFFPPHFFLNINKYNQQSWTFFFLLLAAFRDFFFFFFSSHLQKL